MSKYGYVGKDSDIPQQVFKANAGVLSVNDHLALSQENKLTQYGQLELIETQTASNDTFLQFSDIKEDIYNVHLLITSEAKPSTNDHIPNRLRFYESGVLESASVYQYALQFCRADGTFVEVRSTAVDYINIGIEAGTGTGQTCNSYTYLYNLGDSSKYSFATFHTTSIYPTNLKSTFGSGVLPQTSTVDGLYLYSAGTTTSNIASGTFSLYGIKEYS
jgi:hypothetical protein